MSPSVAAAMGLLDVLEQENVALRQLDLPAATLLLDAKRAALSMFESRSRENARTEDADAAMRVLARRLQDAAAENKRLLERAMRAQHHVMSLLAHAARQSRPGGRYAAHGGYAGRQADSAFALSARA